MAVFRSVDSSFVPASKRVSQRTYFSAPIVPHHNSRPSHKSRPIELKKTLPEGLLNAQEKMTPLQRALFLGIRDSSVMGLLSEKDRKFLDSVKKNTSNRDSQRTNNKSSQEIFEEEPLKAHRFKNFVHYLKRGKQDIVFYFRIRIIFIL
jgi:hypothetical protein